MWSGALLPWTRRDLVPGRLWLSELEEDLSPNRETSGHIWRQVRETSDGVVSGDGSAVSGLAESGNSWLELGSGS